MTSPENNQNSKDPWEFLRKIAKEVERLFSKEDFDKMIKYATILNKNGFSFAPDKKMFSNNTRSNEMQKSNQQNFPQ